MLVTGCPVSFPSPTLESRKAQISRQMASYDSDLQSLGLFFSAFRGLCLLLAFPTPDHLHVLQGMSRATLGTL